MDVPITRAAGSFAPAPSRGKGGKGRGLRMDRKGTMILTPHMLIGAAIAKRIPHWGTVFMLAIASHYLLDKIPHWEYATSSLKKLIRKTGFFVHPQVRKSSLKVVLDFVIGLSLILFFCWNNPFRYLIIGGGLFALIPDFLLLLYWRTKNPYLEILQKFHHKVHSQNKNPLLIRGLPAQIIISLIALLFLYI